MTYKYSTDTFNYFIVKYMDNDEEVPDYECFEEFKDAKQCLLEALDKKVKWALQVNSRNYNKWRFFC